MKILVTAKRVEDPESKIKVDAAGKGIVKEGLKYKINPFDEIAVEEALRLAAKFPGDVVAVSIGGKEVHEQLRHALAMGATKAVWVNHEGPLDQMGVAGLLKKIVEKEKPDLVILGKQSIDDDEYGCHGHTTFASVLSLATSVATSGTLMPALRAGGMLSFVTMIFGVTSTPSALGVSSSSGLFFAFMMPGSEA